MKRIIFLLTLLIIEIAAFAQSTASSEAYRSKFLKLYFTDSLGTILPYRLLTPPSCDTSNTKYPVLLFLHGAGERGNDNEAQLSYIDKVFGSDNFMKLHPCYVIIPQCAEKYRWCETDWTLPYHTMPTQISKYLHAANSLLDSIAALSNADTCRIYVTGMSMGGFGTWDIISRYPYKFAAAMPICGGADEKIACRIKNIPIKTFHGATDKLVNVSRSRNIVKAIKTCGGNNIEYTEFPNMGHLIWNKVYSNNTNIEWLFSNKLH